MGPLIVTVHRNVMANRTRVPPGMREFRASTKASIAPPSSVPPRVLAWSLRNTVLAPVGGFAVNLTAPILRCLVASLQFGFPVLAGVMLSVVPVSCRSIGWAMASKRRGNRSIDEMPVHATRHLRVKVQEPWCGDGS